MGIVSLDNQLIQNLQRRDPGVLAGPTPILLQDFSLQNLLQQTHTPSACEHTLICKAPPLPDFLSSDRCLPLDEERGAVGEGQVKQVIVGEPGAPRLLDRGGAEAHRRPAELCKHKTGFTAAAATCSGERGCRAPGSDLQLPAPPLAVL